MQSSLADAIDEHIACLVALRQSAIVQELHPDPLDPDHLRRLAELEVEMYLAQDSVHHQIARAAGMYDREYILPISDALQGNLDFELRDKADRLEEEREAA